MSLVLFKNPSNFSNDTSLPFKLIINGSTIILYFNGSDNISLILFDNSLKYISVFIVSYLLFKYFKIISSSNSSLSFNNFIISFT